MKIDSAGRALMDLTRTPSDPSSALQPQLQSGSSQGGPDSRRTDFDVAVTDAAMKVCLGYGKLRPKNADEVVTAVGMELTGYYFFIARRSPLYKLIESRVERLIRAGVIVERDGGIGVGQEVS